MEVLILVVCVVLGRYSFNAKGPSAFINVLCQDFFLIHRQHFR